jgi:GMP synthase (glutamine-hydrolysing)
MVGRAILSTMQQPILIILHQEHSTPGRVGYSLRQLGYSLDVRRPRFGDPLPATLRDHAAAIIFGGPMSANDEDDFICREIDWIAVPLKEDKPFLGICLGAQMCARALGGRVFLHPQGQAEIGYYPIRPTPAGLAVVDPWPEQVYQWHREGFDLPGCAELLAEGDMFEVQAFRYGRSYALQFHPDVTHAMMHRWTTRGHVRLEMPGAKPRAAHFADREVYDYSARAWLSVFLGRWIGIEAPAGA